MVTRVWCRDVGMLKVEGLGNSGMQNRQDFLVVFCAKEGQGAGHRDDSRGLA